MPNKLVLKLVIALGVATTFTASAQTRPPTKLTDKKPANKQAPATEVPATPVVAATPAAAAPPPFAPVIYKDDTKAIEYLKNEPQMIYEWVLSQATSIPGKPDQFSSSEDRQKYDQTLNARMSSIGPLPIVSVCPKKYEPDSQIYETSGLLHTIKDSRLKDPDPEVKGLKRLTLTMANRTKETYTAQNGYGATVEVSKSTWDEYVLAFTSDDLSSDLVSPGSAPNTPPSYSFSYLKMTIKMPPAEAREADKKIACVYVISLKPPYTFKFKEVDTPRRDFPFAKAVSGYGLPARLHRMMVVNNVSGELYAQSSWKN